MKEFMYKGKSVEELKRMDIKELAKILNARTRRSLLRGFTDAQKKLLSRIKEQHEGNKKPIKTHCRDIIVIPEMFGLIIHIHNGKEFIPVSIVPEMIGHHLGEFTYNRKKVAHSAPGIGATRSSAAVSVK